MNILECPKCSNHHFFLSGKDLIKKNCEIIFVCGSCGTEMTHDKISTDIKRIHGCSFGLSSKSIDLDWSLEIIKRDIQTIKHILNGEWSVPAFARVFLGKGKYCHAGIEIRS